MKTILNEVLSKIKTTETLKTVADKGVEKVVASAVGATVLDLGAMFGLLILLEIIDIFTACIYQASLLYRAMYGPEITKKRGSLLTYIKFLPKAHNFRYIDSFALRDGFWSKTICYFLLILTGFFIDGILGIRHIPQYALTIFCGILACTEGLSVCENLNAAGVSVAGEISGLLKKRKEQIK